MTLFDVTLLILVNVKQAKLDLSLMQNPCEYCYWKKTMTSLYMFVCYCFSFSFFCFLVYGSQLVVEENKNLDIESFLIYQHL